MKRQFFGIAKICATTLLGFSLTSLIVVLPSLADTNSSLDSDTNSSIFDPNGTGFNPMELMRKANQGTVEYDPQEKSQQLDSQAADYIQKQNQQLQSQQQQSQQQQAPQGWRWNWK